MKSQTTANILKSDSNKKERTPFRLDRTKNRYDSDADVKIKRSELIGLSSTHSNSSNYHDSYTKMKSNDSGYYDGYRGYGKENIYKSKYDPDVLLSEISSNNGTRRTSSTQQQPYAGSSTSRQIKAYKRTESGDKRRTAINLYELLNDEDSELNNRQQRRHQYMQRKSTGTQLRVDNQLERRELLEVSEDQTDLEKTERENKRKEIQSLIMKYAQMDDFYGKTSAYSASSSEKEKDSNNNISSAKAKVDPWYSRAKLSPVVIPKRTANPLGKSQTMSNISSHHEGNSNYSSWYMSNYNGNNVVPIKTNVTPSTSKSRMSKALSTFVRVFTIQKSFSCLLLAQFSAFKVD